MVAGHPTTTRLAPPPTMPRPRRPFRLLRGLSRSSMWQIAHSLLLLSALTMGAQLSLASSSSSSSAASSWSPLLQDLAEKYGCAGARDAGEALSLLDSKVGDQLASLGEECAARVSANEAAYEATIRDASGRADAIVDRAVRWTVSMLQGDEDKALSSSASLPDQLKIKRGVLAQAIQRLSR